MNGAQALADALAANGVTHVFGTPGESMLPWYKAARDGELVHIMARCERCAGYMADVFGRLTNRVAVCDAPGGIGSPHLLPALHEAHNSSTPMIVLTSATPEKTRGTWATSEIEHTDMFRPTVKAVLEVRLVERLQGAAKRSIEIAASGRPGPVHLDVGADVLVADAELAQTNIADSARFPSHRPRPATNHLADCVDLIKRSHRPLIVAGGGTQLSNASDALTALVEATSLPCATTFNGKGSIAENNQYAVGVVGAKGSLRANELAEKADLIIWLGSKGGDKSTNYRKLPSGGAKSIQVDIDPTELNNILSPTAAIQSDVQAFAEDLTRELVALDWQTSTEWQNYASEHATCWPDTQSEAKVSVAAMVAWLNANTPDNTTVIADASRSCSWIGGLFKTRRNGRSVIAPRGSGSIGYALPGAIAACIARPNELVIGIGGDGGLGMSVHEMETASRIGVSPVFILLNDGAFGLLNEVSAVTLDEPKLIEEFANTNWSQIASGFGWNAIEANSTNELLAALHAAIELSNHGTPTLIDAHISSAEHSPDVSLFRSRHGNT